MRKLLISVFLILSFALQGQTYSADPLYRTADDWYEEHSPYSSLPGYEKSSGPRRAPIDTRDGQWIIGDDTDGYTYYITKNGRDYYRQAPDGSWEYLVIIGSFMGFWIPVSAPNLNKLDYYAGAPIGSSTILSLFCLIYIFVKWKRRKNSCGKRLPGELLM